MATLNHPHSPSVIAMIMPVMLLFILLVFLLGLLLVIISYRPRHCRDLAAFSAQRAACPSRLRRASMGKRGAAALGAPATDLAAEFEHSRDLGARWIQWQEAHPARMGQPLQRVSKTRGPPRDPSKQIAGGLWTRRRKPAAGAASGASTGLVFVAEWLFVPFAQRIKEGQETAAIGESDGLFVYRDPASGEKFQHTTSMARMVELAKTHPVVATWTTSPQSRLGPLPAHDDERGRAVSAEQGEFILSVGLSLLGGKVFNAGMTTKNVAPSLVACWWRPVGSGWRPCDIQFARRVWLDLCEGDWTGVVGSSTCDDVLEEDADSAAAGAASGAPEGREKKIADSNSPPRGASESEAEEVQAESERFGPDAEEEDSPGAASGALVPYGLGGTSADDLARASDWGRQVHFDNATTWPIHNMGSRPCSSKKLKQRREGVLALVAALMRDGCPVPTNPSEFHRALPRLLSRSEKSRDELFDVPRALDAEAELLPAQTRRKVPGREFSQPAFLLRRVSEPGTTCPWR